MTKCQATTRDGRPCQAFACLDSDYCYTHDPAKAVERAAAHRRGGRKRMLENPTPFPDCNVESATGLVAFMGQAIHDTWKIQNSLTRARTLAYLVQVQRSVLEVGTLEQRIARLEQAWEAREGK